MTQLKILENFLEQDDLDSLVNLNYGEINDNEIKVFNNSVNQDGVIFNSIIEKGLLQKLNKNYHHKAIEILRDLCPEKIKLYHYSDFHIIVTGKNYKFPIHTDILSKILSGVVYLNPEFNKGTIFYESKKGDSPSEIAWKKNRAVFFSRSKNSYHSYESDKKSIRICLVYNLMTRDLKSVCKIEKINYYLETFKEYLNPLFLKYFNKIL